MSSCGCLALEGSPVPNNKSGTGIADGSPDGSNLIDGVLDVKMKRVLGRAPVFGNGSNLDRDLEGKEKGVLGEFSGSRDSSVFGRSNLNVVLGMASVVVDNGFILSDDSVVKVNSDLGSVSVFKRPLLIALGDDWTGAERSISGGESNLKRSSDFGRGCAYRAFRMQLLRKSPDRMS